MVIRLRTAFFELENPHTASITTQYSRQCHLKIHFTPSESESISFKCLDYSRAYSDVRESLAKAQQLYSQWCMLLEDQTDLDKVQTASTDLRSCIKSIEWDLQDLEETISQCLVSIH